MSTCQLLSAETHAEQIQHRLPMSDNSPRRWPLSFTFPVVNKNILFFPLPDLHHYPMVLFTKVSMFWCKVPLVYWSPNPQCAILGYSVFKGMIKLNEANRVLWCVVMTGVFMRRGRDTRTVFGLASPLQHVCPEERPCEGKLPWGSIWSQVNRYPPCLWSDPLAWRTVKRKLLLSTQKGRERNSVTPSSGTQKATVHHRCSWRRSWRRSRWCSWRAASCLRPPHLWVASPSLN